MNNATEVHDFDECLRASHEASDLPLWRDVYRQAFPDMRDMIDHRKDGWHQRQGIDRSITRECSKQVLIDEKIRGRNKITKKVYTDIALEYVSNTHTNAPGWVCKSLMADYIAYAIGPLGKCYLLPVPQLQQAWRLHSREWLANPSFRNIAAKNPGYETLSCCVPVETLFPAIGACLRFEFTPIEWNE